MSMTEGTLAEWKVANGSWVNEGDVIYILETDKTAREIEAPASGTLIHKVESQETYECGTEIGEIV
jgi:pyruvate/2-oxoglutarate dehydrogenase complex dihydrolipoamide acyltransferase (E2) component